jgi:colanic acid/amylovoran biosynthesis protein
VREKEGLAYVRIFSKNNVAKTYDIVLQNEGYNLSNIYYDSSNIQFHDVQIDSKAVGIIPNLRVIERINQNEFYWIYKKLINQLINAKKQVYILRHSVEDLEICKNIKKLFPNNTDVQLIADDLACIELENIIKQFDFVIASRYHSIVHSYKNGVPALVIGWATKYFELLETFNQQDYLVDTRNGIDVSKIDIKLDTLLRNYENEREKIIEKMAIIRQNSIIDSVFETNFLIGGFIPSKDADLLEK